MKKSIAWFLGGVLAAAAAWPAAAAREASIPRDEAAALHLANRLGYGPAPGELQDILEAGTSVWIERQLQPENIPLPPQLQQRLAALSTQAMDAARLFREYALPSDKKADPAAYKASRKRARIIEFEAEDARLLRALYSPRQLQEVMTEFWFNHFNVFGHKGNTRLWTGDYYNVIRAHALGNFRELLEVTSHHPAMLVYLDNGLSVAPRAGMAGDKKRKGLNENYARELMELHTLGVDGGYTQADVIALAGILSGWTVNVGGMRQGDGQAFRFASRRHVAGDKQLLGHAIKGGGESEGEQALDLLATQPATARHISRQLAQFFLADEPAPELVQKMAATFSETHGDIKSVLRSLFYSPEFWDAQVRGKQFKTPYVFALSALRAAGTPVSNFKPIVSYLKEAGQPVYRWTTPDGYKVTREAWLNSDAMLRRVNLAAAIGAGRLPVGQANNSMPDVEVLLKTLGPQISDKTRAAAEAAEPSMRAGMILGSPDFMTR